jgi:hypothetical protein
MPKWPNTSDHWIVDLSFKDFRSTFKTCSKKEKGLLPNGKLMDFFKVEINFFHMEKGCTFIVGNIFLVLRQSFFLDTFFVYLCAKSEVHQVCDKLSNFLLCPNQCFFFIPQFYNVATMAIIHKNEI